MDIEDEFLLKKILFTYFWLSSLITHLVKNLPTMQEAQDQPLGREDPVEKEMATQHSQKYVYVSHSVVSDSVTPWTV